MTAVGLVYLTLPRLVLAPILTNGSARAMTIAGQLLIVTAFLQFFDCAQNIGVGLLRGLDDTRSGFRITVIGYWAVGLPAAWLLAFALHLETVGIWLGLLTGLAATALPCCAATTPRSRRHTPSPFPAHETAARAPTPRRSAAEPRTPRTRAVRRPVREPPPP
ncbi:MATE family efflux transporter [Streptomyces sp. NPDC090119]|uniref:MATE family efflux transporter n=1 Tax=Streptomyces sp. NPDC090119 TaxID=3365951 RepID=UPI003813E377